MTIFDPFTSYLLQHFPHLHSLPACLPDTCMPSLISPPKTFCHLYPYAMHDLHLSLTFFPFSCCNSQLFLVPSQFSFSLCDLLSSPAATVSKSRCVYVCVCVCANFTTPPGHIVDAGPPGQIRKWNHLKFMPLFILTVCCTEANWEVKCHFPQQRWNFSLLFLHVLACFPWLQLIGCCHWPYSLHCVFVYIICLTPLVGFDPVPFLLLFKTCGRIYVSPPSAIIMPDLPQCPCRF